MWKYLAFKIAGIPLSYLPRAVGYLIARVVADTVHLLSPTLRGVIADNMRHALGSEADDATLRKATKGVLRNAARNYFDLIKLPHMKLSDIERCITVHGWHNLEDALKMGKGVILVTAHLGSFDMGMQILATQPTKVTVLAEPLEPEALLTHITGLRKSMGLTLMPVHSGVKNAIMQSLHRGEVIVLACDRDFRKDGYRSTFFGEETTIPPGSVRIAMRTGAAVIPAFNLRRGDNHYDAYFEPALEIVTGGDEALARNMEQLVRVMEKYIKLYPEQWVVLSPIWGNVVSKPSLAE
jgi:KDO2-lipid IV(A) lauroyltransferase